MVSDPEGLTPSLLRRLAPSISAATAHVSDTARRGLPSRLEETMRPATRSHAIRPGLDQRQGLDNAYVPVGRALRWHDRASRRHDQATARSPAPNSPPSSTSRCWRRSPGSWSRRGWRSPATWTPPWRLLSPSCSPSCSSPCRSSSARLRSPTRPNGRKRRAISFPRPSRPPPARCAVHASFCSSCMVPTSRTMAASLGKMATTLVWRLISPLSVRAGWSNGAAASAPWGRTCGERVVLGLVHPLRRAREARALPVGDGAPFLARGAGAPA